MKYLSFLILGLILISCKEKEETNYFYEAKGTVTLNFQETRYVSSDSIIQVNDSISFEKSNAEGLAYLCFKKNPQIVSIERYSEKRYFFIRFYTLPVFGSDIAGSITFANKEKILVNRSAIVKITKIDSSNQTITGSFISNSFDSKMNGTFTCPYYKASKEYFAEVRYK